MSRFSAAVCGVVEKGALIWGATARHCRLRDWRDNRAAGILFWCVLIRLAASSWNYLESYVSGTFLNVELEPQVGPLTGVGALIRNKRSGPTKKSLEC